MDWGLVSVFVWSFIGGALGSAVGFWLLVHLMERRGGS